MKNPFEYGSAVRGNAFYDREDVKRDIRNVLDGGNNVLLYGPRRYGKSSLMAQMTQELVDDGKIVISLDMMEVSSLDVFVRRYAALIYRALAPSEGTLKRLAGGNPSLSVAFASRTASDADLIDVLDLPERLADGRSVVVVLDEFQEVSRLMRGKTFERIMRARIQHHHAVSYVFLGSRKHVLRRMFTSRKEPFYNSAETFLLEKPPLDESVQFLVRRFSDGGFSLSQKLANAIVAQADNIPYYVQAIASWVFSSVAVRRAKAVSQADVDDAYRRLCLSKQDLFETLFASCSESQGELLVALAQEPTSRFDADYRERHRLGGSSTINTALKYLLESGHVDFVEGMNRVADPLFAHWLVRTRES